MELWHSCEPRVKEEWKSHLVPLEKAFPLGVWPPSCCSSHGTEGEAAEEPFPKEKAASSQLLDTSPTCTSKFLVASGAYPEQKTAIQNP